MTNKGEIAEKVHRMTRRSAAHDYSRPGIYHITMHVAEGLGKPFGTVTGNDADTAAVALTPVGVAVEHELLTAITAHYPMVTVDAYVIMPEHLHFILVVSKPIVSSSGRPTHLGQVIAGFKKGCNCAYWGVTGQTTAGEPPGTLPATVPCGSPSGKRTPSNGSTGRPTLFAHGYCDVMPIEPGQLDTMRNYICENPRSRWLRTQYRDLLQPQRGGIDTALTTKALRGYLLRECPRHIATADMLAQIEQRLLVTGGKIACDSYGDRKLLQLRLLPVVCHRRDAARFEEQKDQCMNEAARGTVLVSPRIAQGEQAIMDEAMHRGYSVAIIADNGFPPVYHPSADRISRCAEGRLLLISPWRYEYRGKNEAVTVPFCKTMNCIAQAISRSRDDWWRKENTKE